ncbi:MAG: ABC transporter substrate-binding protein [Methylobacter sp.]|nr:ABC transporter substrate-binding protein [Methylobacter sp.]MDP2430001.1 ABC transporter substrate-binding protein [Methylobacter sp.]MDP3054619.1 ABC transporter substrate-binding protein [Methylobacter sp.]MDP3362994.1 ABC transporter substrate-binding protein [Methylobacter sp.]MDZ4220519.1 ABC transporter substrate-binding protein [Methylobacter sp.]
MRNQTQCTARWILFSLILLGLTPAATAIAENLLPPQQAIHNVSSQLQQKMKDKSFTRNFAHVVQFVDGVIDPHTDFNQIAQLVLGRHWRTATPQEQQRFKQEFKTLLVRTYSRAFVEYTDWSMRFRPLQMPNAATRIIVRTDILQPGRQAVDVSYRMLLQRGEWKVYDIIIEGVSLVTNYRTTFNDQIQKKGALSIVIDELAQRNAEALSGQGS